MPKLEKQNLNKNEVSGAFADNQIMVYDSANTQNGELKKQKTYGK